MHKNEKNFRVSILIPCYNGAQFINRCFTSILNQTESSIEIILMDDGSTDSSVELARNYVAKFQTFGHILKVFQKENGGAASAIKYALEYSTGKYIIPLDIDDELLPDSCKSQADFLENNIDYGLVLTDGYRIHGKIKLDNIRSKDIISKEIFNGLLEGKITNIPGSYMIDGNFLRDFYSSHEFLITKYGQNLQLLMPSSYYLKTGYIDRPLLNYHIHVGSHSNPGKYNVELENLKGYCDIRLKILKIMDLESEEYKLRAIKAYLTCALIADSKYRNLINYNKHYSELKKLRKLTLQEKTDFHIINNNLLQYYYRFLLKWKC